MKPATIQGIEPWPANPISLRSLHEPTTGLSIVGRTGRMSSSVRSTRRPLRYNRLAEGIQAYGAIATCGLGGLSLCATCIALRLSGRVASGLSLKGSHTRPQGSALGTVAHEEPPAPKGRDKSFAINVLCRLYRALDSQTPPHPGRCPGLSYRRPSGFRGRKPALPRRRTPKNIRVDFGRRAS